MHDSSVHLDVITPGTCRRSTSHLIFDVHRTRRKAAQESGRTRGSLRTYTSEVTASNALSKCHKTINEVM